MCIVGRTRKQSESPHRPLEKNMRNVRRLLTFLFFAACLTAQSKQAAKIDASAVWQIPSQFLSAAHSACDHSASSASGECWIGQMAKAGASTEAVSFTRELYKESHGDFGIMTGFQDEGPVAFAWITYPLRANTNNGFLLVNGEPRIINVEDLQLLDTKTMRKTPQFQDVKAQFPKVDVWPGDRDGRMWPNSQAGLGGGIQFSIAYPLRNGCHACASAGSAIFNWNFNAQGKFLGTAFQGMLDPPLQ
jgi:hypothetical protein